MIFSEIFRFEDYGFNRRQDDVGKWGCQVFDSEGNYITCLVTDTMEEMIEIRKEIKKNGRI